MSTTVPPPFVAGSATSEAAAESVKDKSNRLRRAVLEYIQKHGPVTDEQVQLGLGMSGSTQRPRRVELVRQGLVQEHDKLGITIARRRAVRWIATKRP